MDFLNLALSEFSDSSLTVLYLETFKNQLSNQLSAELALNKLLLNQFLNSKTQPPINETVLSDKCLIQASKIIRNEGNQKENNEVSDNREVISMQSKMKNDTKNIPKNYGKAILSYIQKNTHQTKKLISQHNISFSQFMAQVRRNKMRINSIADLRTMWGEGDYNNSIKKCLRILSHQFMRKHCLRYIFRSRVKNYGTHIKYRRKIIQGIEKPSQFTNIKEY